MNLLTIIALLMSFSLAAQEVVVELPELPLEDGKRIETVEEQEERINREYKRKQERESILKELKQIDARKNMAGIKFVRLYDKTKHVLPINMIERILALKSQVYKEGNSNTRFLHSTSIVNVERHLEKPFGLCLGKQALEVINYGKQNFSRLENTLRSYGVGVKVFGEIVIAHFSDEKIGEESFVATEESLTEIMTAKIKISKNADGDMTIIYRAVLDNGECRIVKAEDLEKFVQANE